MQKSEAQKIVKRVLEQPFSKGQFYNLVINLLNTMNKEKAFSRPQTGQHISAGFQDSISSLDRIGRYIDLNDKVIDILIVKLKKDTTLDRGRKKQRNYIAKYLKEDRGGQLKDGALVAFVSPNQEDWRFSFVKMEYRFDENGKVKEDLTPARRYSFLVGENESSHTAQKQLVPLLEEDDKNPTLEELETAFSVEKVTKEFFAEYHKLFCDVKEALDKVIEQDPKIKLDFEKKKVLPVEFSKKLLGQIVFLYFLQKKGWFGVKRGEEWGTGPKHFLYDLFNKQYGLYNNFFNDVLEPLFYEALRGERSEDYYKLFDCRIPFLNGGLFEPIGGYDWVNTDILLPNSLFLNTNKTKEGDTGDGIFDIFNRYNFTVNEDEPLEKEVAVDPEMLGKVFENLLGVKDRKSKGTYYTPREIVHYMCQESLINYLHSSDFGARIPKTDIEELIKKSDLATEHDEVYANKQSSQDKKLKGKYSKPKLPQSIIDNAVLIDKALDNIRVCDPAIGSGAFLVGMMSEIIRARQALTCFIKNSSRASINHRDPYHLKRHCIEHCLYGVDVDPGAIEIAKLRLWLSLVVDEEEREKVKPLPNLDYKLICGNSLLGIKKDDGSGTIDGLFEQHLKELHKKKNLYFNETSTSKKKQYKKEIDKFIDKIYAPFIKGLEEENKYKAFDFEIYFSEVFLEKKGFDIVIANPPWISNDNLTKKEKIAYRKIYEVAKSRFDLSNLFVEKSISILQKNRSLFFVMPEHVWLGEYFRPFREFLLKNVSILEILSSKEQSFEGVSNPSSIFHIKNTKLGSNNQDIKLGTFYTNKPQKFSINTNITERVFFDKFTFQIIEKIESFNCYSLEEIAYITDGIQTANLLKIIFSKNPINKEKYNKALRSGKAIKFRYASIKWDGWWVLKPEYTKKYKRPGFSYDSPKRKRCFNSDKKIILRQTEPSLFATLDIDKYFFPNSIFQICLRENKDSTLYWLLGLLNSRFLRFFYTKISQVEGTTKPQIYINLIKKLPIRDVTLKEQQPLIDLVDKILSITKAEDYLQNQEKQAQVKKYENQIDKLVYKLYNLIPEEIKIIEAEKR